MTVVDETGKPIEGAQVEVVSYGGWYDEAPKGTKPEEFVLKTNAIGEVSYTCHRAWVVSSENVFGLTLSRSVRLPHWRVCLSAEGYLGREDIQIDTPENRRLTRIVGTRKDELAVTFPLNSQPK
jgi:hypothetical protein